jgi:hypothetical protein
MVPGPAVTNIDGDASTEDDSASSLYIIKSSSITSLTAATGTSPRTAVLSAKAVVEQLPLGGVCEPVCAARTVEGNVAFRLDLEDGATEDKASVTASSSKTSDLLYSNWWVKTGKSWASTRQAVVGGSIAIS